MLSVIFLVHISDIRAESSSWLPAFIQTRLCQKQVVVSPQIAICNLNNNTDLKQLSLQLRDIALNSNIHAILLLIDNNGGDPALFSVVHDMVLRVKKIKPVVGLVTGSAYSGGYWVASACDYLIAHSVSGIGSIGAIRTIERHKNVKYKGAKYEADVNITIFTAGKRKGLGDFYVGDLTDDERAYLQAGLDKMYQLFINSVAQNRNLNIDQSEEWAEGKIFASPEGLELGLIDEIGTFFEAEQKILEFVGQKYSDLAKDGSIRYVTIN